MIGLFDVVIDWGDVWFGFVYCVYGDSLLVGLLLGNVVVVGFVVFGMMFV